MSEILSEAARLERESPHIKLEPFHFDLLFETRLEQRYSPNRSVLAEESHAQSDLIARLHESNATFLSSRTLEASTKDREKALQALENAYFKYREIVGNLETGRTFYNDLAKLLSRFREEVKSWVYARMAEGRELDRGLAEAMAGLRISGQGEEARQSRTPERRVVVERPSPVQKAQRAAVLSNSPSVMNAMQALPPPANQQKSVSALESSPESPPNRTRTPLAAPVPTRLGPQRPNPAPGLWSGDGRTPIKFAGELPGGSRKGVGKGA